MSLEELKLLAERAGFHLSQEELKEIEPLYKNFRQQVEALHQVGLGNQEPAIAFSAGWDPSLQVT